METHFREIADTLDIPITDITGIGKKNKELFEKLGIKNLYNLITYFPFRYEDRSNIDKITDCLEKKKINIIATVIGYDYWFTRRKRILKIKIADESAVGVLVCFNREFLRDKLIVGKRYFITGYFEFKFNEFRCSSFEYEEYKGDDSINYGRIIPVYRLTVGLRQTYIRSLIYNTINDIHIEDSFPRYLIDKRRIADIDTAIKQMHFPDSFDMLEYVRKSIAYREFLYLQLVFAKRHFIRKKQKKPHRYKNHQEIKQRFISNLEFDLTQSQLHVINTIYEDMLREYPMKRLIQGDVGCGKTIVAFAAAALCLLNGLQVAMMAPTEVLAIQHYTSAKKIFDRFGIEVGLLTGATSLSGIRDNIANGKVQFVIGTHALFVEATRYKSLALVIIDEQHRFGVKQRESLIKKEGIVDYIIMSATPIPRTLTHTLYGDLDFSVIKEMPFGKRDISTRVVKEKEINKVYKFVKDKIKQGEQGYIIYPVIEETKTGLKSVKNMYERLKRGIMKDIRLALLHGRVSSEDKRRIMSMFLNGDIDIIVSTTVIEVGIDNPNANIMVVENAERFGLAQLHQLRGRVGRGGKKGYAIFVAGKGVNDESFERLKIIEKERDGFRIAIMDLKLRGPGEFVGKRQSGMPELLVADFYKDRNILSCARRDAFVIVDKDPDLESEANKSLKRNVRLWYKKGVVA